jgi:heat shock protein HtpX
MTSTIWITFRAVVALVLMAGFYLFGCAVAITLLLVPYAGFLYANQLPRIGSRFFLVIAAVCIGAAGSILWSLVPRRDRFEPPGPQLTANSEPRLFTVLQDVAAVTRQQMPAWVFLVGDVNAWVSHRGGLMGFGSRRVMGLGLPLLQLVSVAELRAIIAHEFGHYRAGDVGLGPWVHKTRGAIARTLQGLSGTFFESLFIGYARMFLRVSTAVSRHQEYLADKLAAETAGAGPLISGLRKVAVGGGAFRSYLAEEFMPVLNAGYAPPLVEGFSTYLLQPQLTEALSKDNDSQVPETGVNQYDTHPRLADRILALKGFTSPAIVENAAHAIDLLNDASSLERALMDYGATAQPQALRPVSWSSVATQVYLPMWLPVLERHAAQLGAVNVETLPTTVKAAIPLATHLTGAGEGYVPGDELARRLAWSVGAAVCAALVRKGWTLETAPGRGFRVSDGHLESEPFVRVEAIIFGREHPTGWIDFCARADLGGSIPELLSPSTVSG